MSSSTRRPGRTREHAVLAIGVVSAVLLAGAALSPFTDPTIAGRAEFSQLAGRVADAVVQEWERILKSPVEHVRSTGGEYVWRDDDGHPTTDRPNLVMTPRPPPRRTPREIAPTQGHQPSAYSALIKESERIEEADPAGALEIRRDILKKQLSPGERAEARLRGIQLATRIGEKDFVREELALAEAELDGSEAREGVSYLLLTGLAAAPSLDPPEREALCQRLIDRWRAGALAMTDERESYGEDGPFVRLVPTREALRERLSALCGGSDLQEDLDRTRADALAGWAVPTHPDDDLWHTRELPGAFLAWHRDGATTRGFVLAWDDLGDALRASLEEHGTLPAGFHLDFAGNVESLGPVVRDWTPLPSGQSPVAGDGFGFWLRHEDPEYAARATSRRLWFLRASLLGMSAFAMAAGVATWRALRRERTLSEMRSAFVANVSHELRTPLSSILLMAENLEEGKVRENALASYHASIRREAGRLRRLVDNVLDFSRIERGKSIEVRAEDIALAGWIADLRSELSVWAERARVELEVDVEPLPEHATIDGESLRRAVLNLLDNALRHGRSREIRFTARAEDGTLVLLVADRGRGIPRARREDVFRPFVRLDDGGAPGTGLGLAIVREIARAHGGDARALEPTDGEGAVLEIRIPLAPKETAAA
jgi:signal transduction histidine kinase